MTQLNSNYDKTLTDNNINSSSSSNADLTFITDAKKARRNALTRNNKDFSLASPTLNKRYRFSVLPTVTFSNWLYRSRFHIIYSHNVFLRIGTFKNPDLHNILEFIKTLNFSILFLKHPLKLICIKSSKFYSIWNIFFILFFKSNLIN